LCARSGTRFNSFGGAATIRWIGRSAFRIEVEPLAPPLSRLGVSLLMEPRETFLLWAFDACPAAGLAEGERDTQRRSQGAFEVYHPQRRGGADSAHESPVPGVGGRAISRACRVLCAAPGPDGRALAKEVMGVLRSLEIGEFGSGIRSQLTVSLPLPVTETRVPLPILPSTCPSCPAHPGRWILFRSRKEEKR